MTKALAHAPAEGQTPTMASDTPQQSSRPFVCSRPGCGARFGADVEQCPSCQTSAVLGRHYRLCRPIAEGGMGRTFLAQDRRFLGDINEYCVLKEIKNEEHAPQFAEQLQREASRLLNLRHPNIPAYRDFFPESDEQGEQRWFLVQEYIEGDDLQAQLNRDGPFGIQHALDIIKEVLGILVYIHTVQDPQKGSTAPILHLDIKPANLVERKIDGKIFLIDFGVASQIHNTIVATYGAQATIQGFTPGFAPFEQTMGYAAPASDLYSLCMTFLVLVTGQSPFALVSPLEGTTNFDQFVSLPPTLAMLMDKMLSLQIKGRLQSASTLLKELQHIEGRQHTLGYEASSSAPIRHVPLATPGTEAAPEKPKRPLPSAVDLDAAFALTEDVEETSISALEPATAPPHASTSAPPAAMTQLPTPATPQLPPGQSSKLREVSMLVVGMLLMAGLWLGSRHLTGSPKQPQSSPHKQGAIPRPKAPLRRPAVVRPPTQDQRLQPPRRLAARVPPQRSKTKRARRRKSAKTRKRRRVALGSTARRRRIKRSRPRRRRISEAEYQRLMARISPNNNETTRRIALSAIARQKVYRSMEHLGDMLIEEPNHRIQYKVVTTLIALAPRSFSVFARVLKQPKTRGAYYASIALGKLGPQARRFAPLYPPLLREHRTLQRKILFALASLKPPRRLLRKAIIYLFSHMSYAFEYNVSMITPQLKGWGISVSSLIPGLFKSFSAQPRRNQERILSAVCRIGPKAHAATPKLRSVLIGRYHFYIRAKAAGALLSVIPDSAPRWLQTTIEREGRSTLARLLRGYLNCKPGYQHCLCK